MQPMTLVILSDRFTGAGFIAGELPDGIVTVNTVPSARYVELRERATRLVVAVQLSSAAGAYKFHNVDTSQPFDVIGRDWSGTYNDVIVARMLAEPYSVQSITGPFTVNDVAKRLDGSLSIFGGESGHTVAVTAGAAPGGITFACTNHTVVASGTTTAGAYTWTLTVTAPNGSTASIVCNATFT